MRRIFSLGEPSVKTRSPSEPTTGDGAICEHSSSHVRDQSPEAATVDFACAIRVFTSAKNAAKADCSTTGFGIANPDRPGSEIDEHTVTVASVFQEDMLAERQPIFHRGGEGQLMACMISPMTPGPGRTE
jgi:hypothetical protein